MRVRQVGHLAGVVLKILLSVRFLVFPLGQNDFVAIRRLRHRVHELRARAVSVVRQLIRSVLLGNRKIPLGRLRSRANCLNIREFTRNVPSDVKVEDRSGARGLKFVLFTTFVFVHRFVVGFSLLGRALLGHSLLRLVGPACLFRRALIRLLILLESFEIGVAALAAKSFHDEHHGGNDARQCDDDHRDQDPADRRR